MFHSWNQAFRTIGFLGVLQTYTQPDVGNVKNNSSNYITYFQSSDIQVLWSSHHLYHLVALLSVIRDLAIAAQPWMLNLWFSLHCFCGKRVFKINTEFCCHLCCSSSHFQSQSFSVYGNPFHLVLVFSHYSFQLMMSSHDLCMPS
jgi:hypothetical protein